MKKLMVFVVTLLMLSLALRGEIIESDSLSAVLGYIHQPNTLVIFDIDNTLARTEDELGSDEWFCHLVNNKMAQGYEYVDAVNAALPLAYYAQFNLPLIPTETTLIDVITELEDKKIYSIGLTSRGLYLAERTHEQLTNIGISFFPPAGIASEFVLHLPFPCLYLYNTLLRAIIIKEKRC